MDYSKSKENKENNSSEDSDNEIQDVQRTFSRRKVESNDWRYQATENETKGSFLLEKLNTII